VWISRATAKEIFEMDELYHFIGRKANSVTREKAAHDEVAVSGE